MAPRRLKSLLLMLATAAATPAWGQAQSPAPTPPTTAKAKTAAAVPDFSGIWAHPYLTGFEPPASGPGPVLNRSRSRNGVANFQQLVGDYTNPILQPEAADVVKKHGEISLAGRGYPTPSNQCWPGGVPYVFWDFLLQMFQQPDQITMIYRHGNEMRHVRMNEPHPAQVTPSWYGDSVGHYEGDTLVIDTVGIKIGPFAMVDMYGTPHSPALHVVERYRLIDYDDAERRHGPQRQGEFPRVFASSTPTTGARCCSSHFTVEDAGVFTMPWTSTITYRRALGEWTDLICAENMHEPTGKMRAQSRPRTSRISERRTS